MGHSLSEFKPGQQPAQLPMVNTPYISLRKRQNNPIFSGGGSCAMIGGNFRSGRCDHGRALWMFG